MRDVWPILVAQGVRAFAYGFGAILLGIVLESRDWSGVRVGALLTAIVAGSAVASLLVGRFGERIGRRNTYRLLFVGMALSGGMFALTDSFPLLIFTALLGTLSTDVVESGPFTSLEQAMISTIIGRDQRTRVLAIYNATATIMGSVGALAAGGPALLRDYLPGIPENSRFFLIFVPLGIAGAALATLLPARAEVAGQSRRSGSLTRSRGTVAKLSALFAIDSFGGGFVVQSYIAFSFRRRFGLSQEVLGAIFFAIGFLQAGSFLLAARIARRIGLLNTMVFTHLPSNVLLAAIAFAPSPSIAITLLLARFALSQMDVPARQAYIATLVDPEERTGAAAYTNSTRTAVRPLGPTLAGISQQISLGFPFLIAGGLKIVYDLALWLQFRRVPLTEDEEPN